MFNYTKKIFRTIIYIHVSVHKMHCKDQGEDISDQPLQSLSPPSPWWTQGLRLVAPLVEHNHRFATLYTFLWTQSLLCRGWLLPLCTSCSIFHAVFQQFTSLRWTQNMCDAEFHWICICSRISWPSIIFRFSLSRNIYRERCIILIGDLGRGQGSD